MDDNIKKLTINLARKYYISPERIYKSEELFKIGLFTNLVALKIDVDLINASVFSSIIEGMPNLTKCSLEGLWNLLGLRINNENLELTLTLKCFSGGIDAITRIKLRSLFIKYEYSYKDDFDICLNHICFQKLFQSVAINSIRKIEIFGLDMKRTNMISRMLDKITNLLFKYGINIKFN